MYKKGLPLFLVLSEMLSYTAAFRFRFLKVPPYIVLPLSVNHAEAMVYNQHYVK
jgi:hypothetical protein